MKEGSEEEVVSPKHPNAAAAGEATPKTKPMCYAFQKGACTRGVKCRFSHEIAPKGMACALAARTSHDGNDEVWILDPGTLMDICGSDA